MATYNYRVTPTVVKTEPIPGQRPGTSGLRKPVKVFRSEHFAENFVQSILDGALGSAKKGCKLVIGGDGRYLSPMILQKIFRICAANGVGHLMVGYNGLMTTPAVSLAIRDFKADGGIILTASHNPGGPDGDFGIKFNSSNGGPAVEAVTDKIYQLSTTIKEYRICNDLNVNFQTYGQHIIDVAGVGTMQLEIFDSVKHYADCMERMFDFYLLKSLFSGSITGKPFRILVDCLHGVTGPYVKAIFHDRLGAFSDDLCNCDPMDDFGGYHPDPNLTYAAELVERMKIGIHDMGAAFDGDGDRNMIIGDEGFFICPSDSLAILARHADTLRYFKESNGVKGYARSMPTAAAVDRVAKKLGRECFEVPTGWKFFGNLMDAGRLSLCGEESFGTGCDFIREKDGIWSALAWLTVAAKCKKPVSQIVYMHWAEFGRNVFTRYDYENCDAAQCKSMMDKLEATITKADFVGKSFTKANKTFEVTMADNFCYKDPIDGSISKNQGLRIMFKDGSRIVYRLSGTGSSGATVRIYMDSYEADSAKQRNPADQLLEPLVGLALELAEIQKFTGRDKPTVIT